LARGPGARHGHGRYGAGARAGPARRQRTRDAAWCAPRCRYSVQGGRFDLTSGCACTRGHERRAAGGGRSPRTATRQERLPPGSRRLALALGRGSADRQACGPGDVCPHRQSRLDQYLMRATDCHYIDTEIEARRRLRRLPPLARPGWTTRNRHCQLAYVCTFNVVGPPWASLGLGSHSTGRFGAPGSRPRMSPMGRLPVLAVGVRRAAVRRTPVPRCPLTAAVNAAVTRRGPVSGSCRPLLAVRERQAPGSPLSRANCASLVRPCAMPRFLST
jgi:hypothetical protein